MQTILEKLNWSDCELLLQESVWAAGRRHVADDVWPEGHWQPPERRGAVLPLTVTVLFLTVVVLFLTITALFLTHSLCCLFTNCHCAASHSLHLHLLKGNEQICWQIAMHLYRKIGILDSNMDTLASASKLAGDPSDLGDVMDALDVADLFGDSKDYLNDVSYS